MRKNCFLEFRIIFAYFKSGQLRKDRVLQWAKQGILAVRQAHNSGLAVLTPYSALPRWGFSEPGKLGRAELEG